MPTCCGGSQGLWSSSGCVTWPLREAEVTQLQAIGGIPKVTGNFA